MPVLYSGANLMRIGREAAKRKDRIQHVTFTSPVATLVLLLLKGLSAEEEYYFLFHQHSQNSCQQSVLHTLKNHSVTLEVSLAVQRALGGNLILRSTGLPKFVFLCLETVL